VEIEGKWTWDARSAGAEAFSIRVSSHTHQHLWSERVLLTPRRNCVVMTLVVPYLTSKTTSLTHTRTRASLTHPHTPNSGQQCVASCTKGEQSSRERGQNNAKTNDLPSEGVDDAMSHVASLCGNFRVDALSERWPQCVVSASSATLTHTSRQAVTDGNTLPGTPVHTLPGTPVHTLPGTPVHTLPGTPVHTLPKSPVVSATVAHGRPLPSPPTPDGCRTHGCSTHGCSTHPLLSHSMNVAHMRPPPSRVRPTAFATTITPTPAVAAASGEREKKKPQKNGEAHSRGGGGGGGGGGGVESLRQVDVGLVKSPLLRSSVLGQNHVHLASALGYGRLSQL